MKMTLPSSISDEGTLYHGSKSDILDSFSNASIVPDTFDVTAIDGAAIVNMVGDPKLLTFDEYAEKLLIPYMSRQAERSTRTDIVFDRYFKNSLKAGKSENRVA